MTLNEIVIVFSSHIWGIFKIQTKKLIFILIGVALVLFVFNSISTTTIILNLDSSNNASLIELERGNSYKDERDSKGDEISKNEVLKGQKKATCDLPLLNPFDSSILKYYQEPKPVQCENHTKYPLLFTTDLRSTLIQVEDPAKYGYYNCCYSVFRRRKGSEYEVDVSTKCHPITLNETKVRNYMEFIQINCTNSLSKNLKNVSNPNIIVDLLGFIHLKKSVERRVELFATTNSNSLNVTHQPMSTTEKLTEIALQKETRKTLTFEAAVLAKDNVLPQKEKTKRGKKVNVVIFVLDTVSHMNFLRVMPLTSEYITKNLSGLGLWGYSKVAENTFPNLVPALTGLHSEELKTKGKCWRTKEDTFDECPFIWKEYASQGYVTAYGEESGPYSNFLYGKKGFKVEPTDYYHNTLTRQQDVKIGHVPSRENICYGPRQSTQVLLNYLKKMAIAMEAKDRAYFHLVWASSLTHNYLNLGQLADKFLLETLQWFQRKGFLENTVFILMSDHGIRWGGIRETLQGKIEERMPFLYFIFPDWFRTQHPAAVQNLIDNKHRLTTPFDLYETLKDLLFLDNIEPDKIRKRHHLNLRPNSNSNSSLPRGMSLFLPVPLERSCTDAGIPEKWCLCRSLQQVPLDTTNNSVITEAARSVVRYINGRFFRFPQCSRLSLTVVLNAYAFQSMDKNLSDLSVSIRNSSDSRLGKQQVTFSLSFRVEPSNATFEATTTRHTNGDWVLSGNVSRTSVYGEESQCVTAETGLRMFCYCGLK